MFKSLTLRDDVDLYYQESGDTTGPALIWLHGFSGNHLSWWRQMPEFSAFHNFAIDQRGFGLSEDRTDGPGPAAFVADLIELMDHHNLDDVVVIGHSMSGWPTTSIASQYPDRIAGIVLSGTPGGIIDAETHGRLLDEGAGSLPTVDPLTAAESYLKNSIKALNLHAPDEFTDIRPTLERLPCETDTILANNIPVLVIAGEADGFMPAPAVEHVSRQLNDAPVEIVSGAGHSVNEHKPTEFTNRVQQFLQHKVPVE